MSKFWQEEAQDEEMMIMEMERTIDGERAFALGLLAAKDLMLTTHQIADRLEASFGKHGAENIARAILGKTLYAEWK